MGIVGIVGGGAFGTAMACVLRRKGHDIDLWAREPEVADAVNRQGTNPYFLKGVALERGIRATTDMAAMRAAQFVLLAPPAQHMRAVTRSLGPHLAPGTPVVSCSKDIERRSLALMPEVLAQTLPGTPVAVLSGPSFAREIAQDLPCGVALACADAALGGVMKNVIAIASGIAAGRKLGENARATLVTLGLREALRLGLAMGAHWASSWARAAPCARFSPGEWKSPKALSPPMPSPRSPGGSPSPPSRSKDCSSTAHRWRPRFPNS